MNLMLMELIIAGVIVTGITGILVMQIKSYRAGEKSQGTEATPTPRLIDGVKADLHRVTHKLALSLEQLDARERVASQQLSEINDLLKSKKGTEKITEIVLDTLIGDKLPRDIYCRDYSMPDGSKLSAALVLKKEVIPVETDFPLESYKKLLRTEEKERSRVKKGFFQEVTSKIDSFAAKYIESKADSIKFGIMYIPSEEAYYEILTQTDLTEYAQKKMIYLTSPQTLSSFLGLILASLRDRKMRQNLEEIAGMLSRLNQSLAGFGKNLETLDKALSSVSHLSKSLQDEYIRIDRTIHTALQKSIEEGE